MAAIPPSTFQIVQHGNTGQVFAVWGNTRREYVSVPGSTAAQQIAEDVAQGAVNRLPGQLHQLLGTNATHFLEGKEAI